MIRRQGTATRIGPPKIAMLYVVVLEKILKIYCFFLETLLIASTMGWGDHLVTIREL